MTCEEDKLISEVLGEASSVDDCPGGEPEGSPSMPAPIDIAAFAVSRGQL